MAATIKDLANETGLGVATISSYLNGGRVREKNRIKIEAAIKKYDFHINEIARGLKTNRTKTVGIVIPDLTSSFFAEIITKLEDLLQEHGYGVLVCDSRSDLKKLHSAVEFLFSKRVDAIINAPLTHDSAYLDSFLKAGKPVILIDRKLMAPKCDNILIDNIDATRMAVEYLIQNGHKKIGYVAGPDHVFTAVERLHGYHLAMLEAGLPTEERFVVHSREYSIFGGRTAMQTLLERNPDMTAVVVTSDDLTVGSMIAINESGISLPNDLSLIGFDNVDFACASHPGLTIVRQPIQEIAAKTVDVLLARLNGSSDVPPQEVRLKAHMIMGKSVKCLRP